MKNQTISRSSHSMTSVIGLPLAYALALAVVMAVAFTFPQLTYAQTDAQTAAKKEEQQPTRNWVKNDDTSTFEATFLKYNPDTTKLTLRLADRTEVELPKSDLSTRDQQFLRRHMLKLKRIAKREAFAKGKRFAKGNSSEPSSNKSASDHSRNDRPKASNDAPARNASTRQLYGINWHSTPEGAKEAATGKSGKKDDRPIIWFRVLGDLADGM